MNDTLAYTLQSGVEEGVYPGAVLFVRFHGESVFHQAVGRIAYAPASEPVTVETLYDLASLTKPLVTATTLLHLVQAKTIQLTDAIERYFPEFKGRPVGAATVEHLLRHSSGLPGWRPIYEGIAVRDSRSPGFLGSADARKFAVDTIGSEALLHPIGVGSVYSDLGFILLGLLIERVTDLPLDSFCRDEIYIPLGIHDLIFRPNVMKRSTAESQRHFVIAPTEDDPWRGRVLKGEVHDENAYALGGVAGHAGLFGTADAVMKMVSVWLDGYCHRNPALMPQLVHRFVSRDAALPESSWGLGWDTPSSPSSSGRYLSRSAFGHLGFTGTSIWVDPLEELQIVLLTNRVHRTRHNMKIQQFRPLIHDAVYKTIVKGRSKTHRASG